MPLFYKKYPNSLTATIVSICSSMGILFAILGVYEIYEGIRKRSDDFFAGLIFLVLGVLMKYLLSKAARRIAEKKQQ